MLIGYVHIKDLLDSVQEQREHPIPAERIRTLPVIRSDEPLRQALTAMQDSGPTWAPPPMRPVP